MRTYHTLNVDGQLFFLARREPQARLSVAGDVVVIFSGVVSAAAAPDDRREKDECDHYIKERRQKHSGRHLKSTGVSGANSNKICTSRRAGHCC